MTELALPKRSLLSSVFLAALRLLWPLVVVCSAFAQSSPDCSDLFKAERWPELVEALKDHPQRSAEAEYEYGIALAHLEKWDEARQAFLRGRKLAPNDKRFPEELAGVAFKQKKNNDAKRYLHRALRLDPKDDYAEDFLGTLYFLDGNLEAAVQHWNAVSKPQINQIRNEPSLRVNPALLDHAITFAALTTLKLDDLRTTGVRLDHLQIFPAYRFNLVAVDQGKFDAVLRAQELNGFGDSKVQAAVRALRGIAFQEVTPEYDNLFGSAINITTLARWDADKRRYDASLSGPLWQAPQWRYWINAGVRNENWDLRTGFSGPAPVLASLNLRREQVSAEIERLVGWRWRWKLGLEVSHRDERTLIFPGALSATLLAKGYQLKQSALIDCKLWQSAEHRASVTVTGSSEAARLWSTPGQSFETLQGGTEFHWLPRPAGDDYETLARIRGGKTFGNLPFDELFMLGLERDNDLWLRGHIGTRDGRKGSAPLGQDYFVANWETDKNLFSNGIFVLKLGPFVDTGKIYNAIAVLGPQEWLVDTGAQLKVRVLGVGVVFSYGKNLRTGSNAFYTRVER